MLLCVLTYLTRAPPSAGGGSSTARFRFLGQSLQQEVAGWQKALRGEATTRTSTSAGGGTPVPDSEYHLRRALARISVVWHGIFAGPWYASLSARGGTGPALPVIYALALQLAFNALLQVAFGLEDPYARAGGRGLHDSVRVRG